MNIDVHRWYAIITDGEKTFVVHAGDGSGIVWFDNLEEFRDWEENFF